MNQLQSSQNDARQVHGPAAGPLIVIGLALGCIALPVGAVFVVAANEGSATGMAVTGGILLILTIAAWFGIVRPSRRSVLVYTDRLVYQRGHQQTEVDFTQINQLYRSAADLYVYGAKVSSTSGCWIIDNRQRRLFFNGFIRDAGEIGRAVEEATYMRLLDDSRQTIERGDVLDCGPIQVVCDGLQSKRGLLRWTDLNEPIICQGVVTLTATGHKPVQVRVCDLANFRVLMELIQQYRTGLKST